MNPLLNVIERIAPYLPSLDKAGRFLVDEFMNGSPGHLDLPGLLLTKPPKDPLPIDTNNPSFDNYNAPNKNKPKYNDKPNACTG